MLDHSSSSNSSLLKVIPNKNPGRTVHNPKLTAILARLDRTSGGPNTEKVTLTCLGTSYSLPNSSTQRFQRRICLQYLLLVFFFFSDKKKKKKSILTTKYISPPSGGGSIII